MSKSIVKTRVSVKKCDIEWLTLKHITTAYLKRWKMHENWGKTYFCPMVKKMISLHTECCIGKCPGLCTISSKLHMVPKLYALSHIYLDFWDTLFHVYAQSVLWVLQWKIYQNITKWSVNLIGSTYCFTKLSSF